MASLRVGHLHSVSELRLRASAWDDLWRRSTTCLPTARAVLVAHWIETLAPDASVHVVCVEDDGGWLAAIPLIEGRLRGMLKAARLPCNEWSSAGDLLIDRNAPDESVDLLLDALVDLSFPLLWFDGVPIEQEHWQRLLAAVERRRLPYSRHERFQIGAVNLTQDWNDYEAAWSGSFRRKTRKITRRAEEEGSVTHAVHRSADPDEVTRLLQTGFEIEDRSWKGRDGTSVLKSPEMHRFLHQQAIHLAELGHLELHFLAVNDQPIAFEYGMISKGCYFSPKVGYDEAHAHLSPGQLLRLKMMHQFFADPERATWDFLGPLVDATDRWSTRTYGVERLAIATSGVSGRLAVRAYRDWWPAVRRFREQWQAKRSAPHEAVSP